MQKYQKLKIFSTRRLFAAALFLVMLSATFGLAGNAVRVSADPPQLVALQNYCKGKIKGKAQAGCSISNMTTIQNSVSGGCKGNNSQTCIKNASQKVIDQIAGKNPKNKNDFSNDMNNIINGGKNQNQNQNQNQQKNQCPTNSCGGASPTGQGQNCDSNNNCDLVALYVNPFINILSIIVGLVVTASLIVGGIQYTASGGDSQRAAAAKSRISNTLLAMLAFMFLYAFLNFLVPGGLFP